jgi:hypothetical protein
MFSASGPKTEQSYTIELALKQRDDDRLQADIQHTVSLPSIVSNERAERDELLSLFTAIQQAQAPVVALVTDIYACMSNLQLSPAEHAFFSASFPFQVFLSIIMEDPGPDLCSLAMQCLGHASHGADFPVEHFANELVLSFLLSCFNSIDSALWRAALEVLGNTVRRSVEARDFTLHLGILPQLRALAGRSMSYVMGEMLFALCSVKPPPDEQFADDLRGLLQTFLDGSPVEVLDLALCSAVALLRHGAPGISGDVFLEFLPQIIASGQPSLVPPALEILQHVSELNAGICEIVLDVLEAEDKPAVLVKLAQVLVHFKAVFQPASGPRIFELLLSKIGKSLYKVEVVILRAAAQYFESAFVSDLRVFKIFLRFASSEEMGLGAMVILREMITQVGDSAVRAEMIAMLVDAAAVFDDLAGSESDELAVAAEQMLTLIDQWRQERL